MGSGREESCDARPFIFVLASTKTYSAEWYVSKVHPYIDILTNERHFALVSFNSESI